MGGGRFASDPGICDDTFENPASSCGCCWSGRWKEAVRAGAAAGVPPEMRCWAGWTSMRGSWIWCSWTSRWRDQRHGYSQGPAGRGRPRAPAGIQRYSDYVFDSYEVGALGYLLKPAGAEELEKVLTRALTTPSSGRRRLSSARSGGMIPHPDAILCPLRPATGDQRHPRRALYFFTGSWTRWLPSWGGVRPHPPAVSGPGGGGGPGDRERGVGRGGDPAHQPLLPAGGAACLDTGGAGVGREWE